MIEEPPTHPGHGWENTRAEARAYLTWVEELMAWQSARITALRALPPGILRAEEVHNLIVGYANARDRLVDKHAEIRHVWWDLPAAMETADQTWAASPV